MARKEITPEQWASARAMWQSDPMISYEKVSETLGISKQAVGKKGKADGWMKRISIADITKRAYQAADRASNGDGGENSRDIKKRMRLVDGIPSVNLLSRTELLSDFEMQQMADKDAIEKRVAVLERHRAEINGPRKLIYEAIKNTGDIEKAKLAKVAAETMKVLQDAERKAWGFDRDADKPTMTVVIERGARRGE